MEDSHLAENECIVANQHARETANKLHTFRMKHLTHFWEMFSFCTPWKHEKAFVFRGFKMGTLIRNGLMMIIMEQFLQRH